MGGGECCQVKEASFGEAVGVEVDAEEVGAEPGEGGDDVAEDREDGEATGADEAAEDGADEAEEEDETDDAVDAGGGEDAVAGEAFR